MSSAELSYVSSASKALSNLLEADVAMTSFDFNLHFLATLPFIAGPLLRLISSFRERDRLPPPPPLLS